MPGNESKPDDAPEGTAPTKEPAHFAEPEREKGGRTLVPDGKDGYREAADWEEENIRRRNRIARGECEWKCPQHGKYCVRGSGTNHAGLGHACVDCIGVP